MSRSSSFDAPRGLSRRGFLQTAAGAGAGFALARSLKAAPAGTAAAVEAAPAGAADHTIRIGTGLVELAPDQIVSTALYNGQFPGPLLRLQEGRKVVVDIFNDTDTPEQLHWHGQTQPLRALRE